MNSGVRDSEEISSEKQSSSLVACLLEMCIPIETGEE